VAQQVVPVMSPPRSRAANDLFRVRDFFKAGVLGKAAIIPVPKGDATDFIGLGGRIPAPIHSLKN